MSHVDNGNNAQPKRIKVTTDTHNESDSRNDDISDEEKRRKQDTRLGVIAALAAVGIISIGVITYMTLLNSIKGDDPAPGDINAPTATAPMTLEPPTSAPNEADQSSDTQPTQQNNTNTLDPNSASVRGNYNPDEKLNSYGSIGERVMEQSAIVAQSDTARQQEREIIDRLNQSIESLKGINYTALESGQGSPEDRDKISQVENFVLYGNETASSILAVAASRGWTVDDQHTFIYESSSDLPRFSTQLIDDSGQVKAYMEGYYDPSIQALDPSLTQINE